MIVIGTFIFGTIVIVVLLCVAVVYDFLSPTVIKAPPLPMQREYGSSSRCSIAHMTASLQRRIGARPYGAISAFRERDSSRRRHQKNVPAL